MRISLIAAAGLVFVSCAREATEDPVGPAALSEQIAEDAQTAEEAQVAAPASDIEACQKDCLRPANYYRIAWSGEDALCGPALQALNLPWISKIPDDADYAEAQAHRRIGSAYNPSWVISDFEDPSIDVDYFNDGVSRRVARRKGELAGNIIIGLGIIENEIAPPALLAFGHAGLAAAGLPEIENLHTKLTYSVSDVILLREGVFTLVSPLEDYDASGNIFLIRWMAKDNAPMLRSVVDYYPAVACLFAPRESAGGR